jgi:hypothetical protein
MTLGAIISDDLTVTIFGKKLNKKRGAKEAQNKCDYTR